jgi:hypothetical protein
MVVSTTDSDQHQRRRNAVGNDNGKPNTFFNVDTMRMRFFWVQAR